MNRSKRLPDVRRRLGVLVGGERLQIVIPNWVKDEVKKYMSEEDAKESLRLIYNIISGLEVLVKAFINTVKKDARIKGITVMTTRVCCAGKRCGTCRGVYHVHLHWRAYVNGEVIEVDSREERDFLRQFIDDKSIDEFYLVVKLKDIVLGIFNYTEAWWEKFGLKEVNEKVEQLPATI